MIPAQSPPNTTVREKIDSVLREEFAGRQSDIVAVADRLLAIAREAGEIRCQSAGAQHLRFEIPHQEPWETQLDAGKGRLRAICARLAKLCEESGQEFLPYGGEGTIQRSLSASMTNHGCQTWKARWKNTMHEQEFIIQAQ
jgi:hypothetical protein